MAQTVLTRPHPAELAEDQLASRAAAVQQVIDQSTYTVSVSMTNSLGKVHLSVSNTGSVGRYDFMALYANSFPSNPDSDIVTYQYVSDGLQFQTNETYGPGWVAAYVSYNYLTGSYVYLAQTPATT